MHVARTAHVWQREADRVAGSFSQVVWETLVAETWEQLCRDRLISDGQGAAWQLRALRWKGDHSPRHVHVYKDRKLVAKWDLENGVAMKGRANSQVLGIIRELQEEGVL